MKRDGYRGPEKAAGDRWLVTFNDLMTLVLTFFVMLLAFSVMKPDYLIQATNSFRDALTGDVLTGGGVMRVFRPFVTSWQDPDIEMERIKRSLNRDRETLARIRAKLTRIDGIVPGCVTDGDATGLNVVLPPPALFDPKSRHLGVQGREILSLISLAMKGEAVFVHVEIDDASSFVSGALSSAAAESTLRAASIARSLCSLGDVDASRITVGPDREKAGGSSGRDGVSAAAKPINLYISTRAR